MGWKLEVLGPLLILLVSKPLGCHVTVPLRTVDSDEIPFDSEGDQTSRSGTAERIKHNAFGRTPSLHAMFDERFRENREVRISIF